jgi:hypothetical protein
MKESYEYINWLIDLLTNNPPIVLALFILSLVANFIQVYTYFRDQRRIKNEKSEQNELTRIINTYEDVLKIAKDIVKDKDKLSELKKEISESTTKASELTESISQLEKAAQKKLISQTIEYNQRELSRLYNEIKDLEIQYKFIGELPDLSPESRKAISDQVELTMQKPYEFPREFVFTSTLLVLFLMFLPWPVDTILLPFLLRYFLLAFFEAVKLYPNKKIKIMVLKHHSVIILLACFGVWFQFFNFINTFLQPILNGMAFAQFTVNITPVNSWYNFFELLPQIIYFSTFVFALLLAFSDWRYLLKEMRKKSLPSIRDNLIKTNN